jgi:hypothetical protein
MILLRQCAGGVSCRRWRASPRPFSGWPASWSAAASPRPAPCGPSARCGGPPSRPSSATEITAAATAILALGKLRHLPGDSHSSPDRQDHLLQLTIAVQDLRNADLRARVTAARRILDEHAAAWSIAGQPEPESRRIACEYAIDCLGAFRRGEPVPLMPEPFTATLAAIDQWSPPKQVRPIPGRP